MHFARSGQWDRAMEHLAAAEKLADGKPGVRWLRYAVMKAARRNEELKGCTSRRPVRSNSPLSGRGAGGEGEWRADCAQ